MTREAYCGPIQSPERNLALAGISERYQLPLPAYPKQEAYFNIFGPEQAMEEYQAACSRIQRRWELAVIAKNLTDRAAPVAEGQIPARMLMAKIGPSTLALASLDIQDTIDCQLSSRDRKVEEILAQVIQSFFNRIAIAQWEFLTGRDRKPIFNWWFVCFADSARPQRNMAMARQVIQLYQNPKSLF